MRVPSPFSRPLTGWALPVLLALPALAAETATATQVISFDATHKEAPVKEGFFHFGTATGPGGTIEINSQYLTLNGRPQIPVMGEFHFTRFPESGWEAQLLKMKAAGVNVVATYVFWNHHEEVRGSFDWTGRRDLRRFIALCAKHHLLVALRIGPWSHGEARYGGFPDWVVEQGGLRENNPAYLASVSILYRQIADQVKGQLWKDGGPIAFLQLENEYSADGPGKGAEHILTLKRLAREVGLDMPVYTVTGWDNARYPATEVCALFGGYPDGFWEAGLGKPEPSGTYLFNFSRTSESMGAISGSTTAADAAPSENQPYFTAETGGGMHAAYHRRPYITSDDSAAVALTEIGSGANLMGYYMFQGGANPSGKLTPLNETQATGYPNDVPEITYDFQAPLLQYGQLGDSYRTLKRLHQFLNAFGSELAPMSVVAPAKLPVDKADFQTVRASVRHLGEQGYLFVNNYVHEYTTPAHSGVQFHVQLPSSTLHLPSTALTIPSGAYFVWPLNLPLGSATLRYATAQLVTRATIGKTQWLVFSKVPGIEPEFCFAKEGLQELKAEGAVPLPEGDNRLVRNPKSGLQPALQVENDAKQVFKILLLEQQDADHLWRFSVNGEDLLVHSTASATCDDHHLTLRSWGQARVEFSTLPSLGSLTGLTSTATADGLNGAFTSYHLSTTPFTETVGLKLLRAPQKAPPVRLGPYIDWRKTSVATVPTPQDFLSSGVWEIALPSAPVSPNTDLYLTFHYAGNMGRLFVGDQMVDDNFYNGKPWQVGLRHLPGLSSTNSLRLEILPLAKDAPIALRRDLLPNRGDKQDLAELLNVSLTPEYTFEVPLSK